VAVIVALIASAAPAWAEHAALPDDLIALHSEAGQRLLVEAEARADYFSLSEHYITQKAPGTCGVASGAMALNALQIPAPRNNPWNVGHFTEENVFNECARRIYAPERVEKGGLTLGQLADIIQCHPARVEVVHASDTTLEEFRNRAKKNLSDGADYMLVNYLRSEVGQEYAGHHSPLAAYNAKADRFLLLDVARYKYPPVWVSADKLFSAMNTGDPVSGSSRGFLIVHPAVTPPGPGGRAKARNPLHLLFGMVGGAFALGAGVGVGLTAWRYRRKLRRDGWAQQRKAAA
jgi:hypothetical protein